MEITHFLKTYAGVGSSSDLDNISLVVLLIALCALVYARTSSENHGEIFITIVVWGVSLTFGTVFACYIWKFFVRDKFIFVREI